MEIYTAGPFFTPAQIAVQEGVEALCLKHRRPFFSPRLKCFCPPDATPEQRAQTFEMNVQHIRCALMVLANIDGYDPGTMWELGYAFAHHIPSFAYTLVPDRKLNLMLAQSGLRLLSGWEEIEDFLVGDAINKVGRLWSGAIE